MIRIEVEGSIKAEATVINIVEDSETIKKKRNKRPMNKEVEIFKDRLRTEAMNKEIYFEIEIEKLKEEKKAMKEEIRKLKAQVYGYKQRALKKKFQDCDPKIEAKKETEAIKEQNRVNIRQRRERQLKRKG